MGQSRGSGYQQVNTLTPQQSNTQNQFLSQSMPWLQQSAQGFQQFLPGGGGGQPIIDAAMKRYQQQTIPSILNAYGSDNKGSSALNQALASSASNLNSDLGAALASMQLQASQGLGSQAQNVGNLGLNTQSFALTPEQAPLWQKLLQALAGGTGGAVSGAATGGPLGAIGGGISGLGRGFGA